MEAGAERVLGAPHEWDRYYQVQTDLDPVLGTPGLPSAALGETVDTAAGAFTQRAEEGFFLVAEDPKPEDPLEVCAKLSGTPHSGFLAAVSGPRQRRSRSTGTGTHVEVEQLVRGARVVGGEMRLHHDERGVFAVTGRPLGDLEARDPGPAPESTPGEALDTCAARFDLEDGLRRSRVEQVVFPEGDGAVWAYEVSFVVPEHAADVRTYLRAEDLSVLLSYNISSSAGGGRARVFSVNPLQTPELTNVNLSGLDPPGTTLRGLSTNVSQSDGTRLERDAGDFVVDPDEPGFDEVQAYFLLERIAEWFGGVVDPAILKAHPFTPMRAFVNDPVPNNAFYSPSTGELRFGIFAGRRSSARSASVVCHEFGHAITDAICQLGRSKVRNTEARGLSEGYSDYFAASFLDDPRLGDYVADNEHGARNCSDPGLRFSPDFTGEEHGTGSVWAAVLWALRERLGTETTDRIVSESVEFLDSSSTFSDAKAGLRAADDGLFGGESGDAIDEEFAARTG